MKTYRHFEDTIKQYKRLDRVARKQQLAEPASVLCAYELIMQQKLIIVLLILYATIGGKVLENTKQL